MALTQRAWSGSATWAGGSRAGSATAATRSPATTRARRSASSAGIDTVASLAELAGGCDVVFLSLPDSTVIEAVV